MSVAVTVFVPKARTKWTAKELGAFIRSAGFDFDLPTFDPRTQVGFLPGRYRGAPAGFEFYSDDIKGFLSMLEDEDSDDFSELEIKRMKQFGQAVELVTHSRFRDGLVAAVAAGCLAAMTGGVVLSNSAGEWIAAQEAVAWAKKQEEQYLPYLPEDVA